MRRLVIVGAVLATAARHHGRPGPGRRAPPGLGHDRRPRRSRARWADDADHDDRRARLGIKVNLQARETDSLGAVRRCRHAQRSRRESRACARATSSPSSMASRCSAAASPTMDRAGSRSRGSSSSSWPPDSSRTIRSHRVSAREGPEDRLRDHRRRARSLQRSGADGRHFMMRRSRPGRRPWARRLHGPIRLSASGQRDFLAVVRWPTSSWRHLTPIWASTSALKRGYW